VKERALGAGLPSSAEKSQLLILMSFFLFIEISFYRNIVCKNIVYDVGLNMIVDKNYQFITS